MPPARTVYRLSAPLAYASPSSVGRSRKTTSRTPSTTKIAMTTRPSRIAARAAIGALVGRGGILEQRVDEGRDRARLGEDDERRDDEQRQDHRRQPPPLVLPEEEQELTGDSQAIDQAFDRAHGGSYARSFFSTTHSPRTSTSMPLFENVL